MTLKIQEAFAAAKKDGRRAFIPYVTGGFPDRAACLELILALDQAGADIIEIGVPFSDPLADGPTIQHSSKLALDSGVTPESVLEMTAQVSGQVNAPLVIMTYYNPVLKLGHERFAAMVREAGAAGVIVPDLTPEEADSWVEAAWKHDLDTIFMAAPTTTKERLDAVVEKCRGFLYYVSITGVTGAGLDISPELLSGLKLAQEKASVPVAVGFGVSTPAQAQALARVCEGVIVGSAIIRLIQENPARPDQVRAVKEFAENMRQGLKVETE